MAKVKNFKYEYFNPILIKPCGWIKDQLTTQLNGLSGHLKDFWKDISESAWIGGNYDSWERVPYWLDGYIPLVYLLNDKEGIKTVKFYIKNIVKRQQIDGWIAPINAKRDTYDVWGIFIVLKAMYDYAYITNDSKVYNSIYKALKALDKHIDKYPLFNWAKFRWFEALVVIYPIYNIYKEEWLITLANKLHNQGFDYFNYYLNDFPKSKCKMKEWNYETHGVNNAMAIKSYALYSLLTSSNEDIKKSNYMLDMLNKYHGNIMGTINADECLAGKDPRQGSELCLIVELMYSLEIMSQITKDSKYLDQLERLAFNALPNALSSDMWSHQYDTQVNAPFIKKSDELLWTNNGSESNIYGLEPHYGCCTSNFHQGWPKFVISSVGYNNKGIFINSLIPLKIKSKNYNISISGCYPFFNDVNIKINSKLNTKLYIHIPHNAKEVTINNKIFNKTGYIILDVKEGVNKYKINIKTKGEFIRNYDGYSLVEGNLVYGLKIDEEIVQINKDQPNKELPHGDFEYHNKSNFNYCLNSLSYRIVEHKVNKNISPFVSKIYPKSYYVPCNEVKYEIKGNYVNLSRDIISKCIDKEFIPLAINKLHLGTLTLKGEHNE